jgi:hypothetical protein
MTNGTITVTPYWADTGALVIEASSDGSNWLEVGRFTPAAYGYMSSPLQANLPPALLPATNLFVKLRTTTGTFIITAYRFEADVPGLTTVATGKTWFWELDQPATDVRPVGMIETSTGWVCRVELRNPNGAPRQLTLSSVTEGPAGTRTWQQFEEVAPQSVAIVDVRLPSAGAGENIAGLEIVEAATTNRLFAGRLPFTVATLHDYHFGYGLSGVEGCEVWWCESLHKVGRLARESTVQGSAVEIAAARNEYEPFQVVLRAAAGLSNAQVSVSDFVSVGLSQPASIAASNVTVSLVDYVPVARASDYSGTTGDHPDPLLPLSGSFSVGPQTNQPLWVTVYVPKATPAGEYEGELTVTSDTLAPITVPVRLRVYDFTLPDTTHTKTAYKVWLDNDWHKLVNLEQQRTVWDLYMENFRRHRVSPVYPQEFSQLGWTVSGETITLNTGAFDEAMERYLDEFGFNGFAVLNPPASLGGYWRHSADYRRLLARLMNQIMGHLRAKGWDQKAYVWWYDEPVPGVYPNLTAEMKAIQDGAPDLKRLTTYQPDPPLYGSVDLWVPFLHNYRYAISNARQRQALGEEFWWYTACWPAYPHPNNYIDHAGINHRLRTWLGERYGVTGDLYWCTMWYKTTNGAPRNPWLDTMSVGGAPLANGDGMVLYPPVKTPPVAPVLAGPIDSLRWELIRESMEDGEYFWLLREALQRGQARWGMNHPAVVEGYAAREQAMGMVRAMDDFEKSPQKLLAARQRMAEAIEALDDGAPFIVTQPVSKTAVTGGAVSLRVEALGWPLSEYQWHREGVALNGATGAVLRLTGLTANEAGVYTVMVSNAVGVINSEAARLEVMGLGNEAPRIVSGPQTLWRRTGEKAVLAAAVAGSEPLSFGWRFNGMPLAGATNGTLLFTNLTAGQFGEYQMSVSNAWGGVTSAVVRIASVDVPPLDMSWAGGPLLTFRAHHRPATLLRSTNLVDWAEWARLLPFTDPVQVLDSEATNSPPTFYKIKTEYP